MTATTGPATLAIDVGASGLKASVLDATGAMVVGRVRVETTYPCPPEALVAALVRKWNQRVHRALETLDALFYYDAVYVGGGNSARVAIDLGPKATLVDNSAGILGSIKIWDCIS